MIYAVVFIPWSEGEKQYRVFGVPEKLFNMLGCELNKKVVHTKKPDRYTIYVEGNNPVEALQNGIAYDR